MKPRTRLLTLVLALAGVCVATGASYVHHRLLVDPSYVSPCDINATFNCSQVYLSRYGTLMGIPVAYGGVAWFVLVTLLVGLHRPVKASDDDPMASYLFALSTVGLAAVFYFAYASFFVLKTGCLFCLGTYVCVIALFLVTGGAATVPMSKVPAALMRDLLSLGQRPLQLVSSVLYVAFVAWLLFVFPHQTDLAAASAPVTLASTAAGSAPPPSNAAAGSTPAPAQNPDLQFEASWAQQPRINVGVPADGAKVVIVKFLDWECPTCKYTDGLYKSLLADYLTNHAKDVKYVEKDFPLSSKCNPAAGNIHPGPCEAAVAVRIATDKGKRSEMIDWIFAHQETADAAAIKAEVASLLGVTDFDLQYAERIPQVQRDIADGRALNITGTPTYFINGVRLMQVLPPHYFKLAIDYELSHAK